MIIFFQVLQVYIVVNVFVSQLQLDLKGTGTEDLTVVNYTLSNEVLINPFQVNFYLMEW